MLTHHNGISPPPCGLLLFLEFGINHSEAPCSGTDARGLVLARTRERVALNRSTATSVLEPAQPNRAQTKTPFTCVGHVASLSSSAEMRAAAGSLRATWPCPQRTLAVRCWLERHRQYVALDKSTSELEPARPRRAESNELLAFLGHQASLPSLPGAHAATGSLRPMWLWEFEPLSLVGTFTSDCPAHCRVAGSLRRSRYGERKRLRRN